MSKRGQGALEFLMTYGWAIIAVLITIFGLAYFGVLNPSLFLPESCTFFPGLACTDVVVGGNSIVFSIRNGIGSTINNLQISIPSLGCSTGIIFLPDGSSKRLGATGCAITGSSVKRDISISYNTGSIQHTRTGSVSAQVGPGVQVAEYTFDDGTANDLSGFGNSGTLIDNTNCNVAGYSNNGCSLDGSGDYIDVLDSQILRLGTSDFTIELYFKSTVNGGGLVSKFKFTGLGPTQHQGYEIKLAGNTGIHSAGPRIGIRLFSLTSSQDLIFNDFGFLDGNFHRATIAVDRANSKVRLYKDSNLVQSLDILMSGDISSNSPLRLGRKEIGSLEHFNGVLDEVKIYSYAIS